VARAAVSAMILAYTSAKLSRLKYRQTRQMACYIF